MSASAYPDHVWAFDLVADDSIARDAALTHHRNLLAEALRGRQWQNRIWALAGSPVPDDPVLAEEMARARRTTDEARRRSLYGPLDDVLRAPPEGDPSTADPALPFVLLFLAWERSHPDTWRDEGRHTWSPWTTKELLLERLGRHPLPAPHRAAVTELVLAAVAGPYRCKDWMYAPIARHLDHAELAGRLAGITGGASATMDPSAAPRARFLTHLLDHPEVRVTRTTWHTWRGGDLWWEGRSPRPGPG